MAPSLSSELTQLEQHIKQQFRNTDEEFRNIRAAIEKLQQQGNFIHTVCLFRGS